MTSKPLEYYEALPELAHEPSALRSVHAIRLKRYDEKYAESYNKIAERTEAAVNRFLSEGGYIKCPTPDGAYTIKKRER